MTIEVYYTDRRIYLIDELQNVKPFVFENSDEFRNFIFDFLKKSSKTEVFVYHSDINYLFLNFKSFFKFIIAAGGLVINPLHEVLAIKVDNVWQLPKGHVEVGETVSEAAIREVSEETSITDLTIVEQLPSTFHIFVKNNNYYLKQTYWFKMITNQTKQPIPQTKERIQFAIWVPKNDIEFIKSKSYPNLAKIWDYAQ